MSQVPPLVGRMALAIAALAAPAAPSLAGQPAIERARLLMGTTCRVTAQAADPAAVEAALDVVARVEDELSTWRPETPLSRFNETAGRAPAAGVEVSPSLVRFLVDCRDWSRRTRGAFDPVVGALIDAWDLRGAGRLPDAQTLRKARAATGMRLLEIDETGGRCRLARRGAWIDSGGIAKGLALDLAAAALRARGVTDAVLDFGGQVLVLGNAGEEGGWPIAIADPRDRTRPAVLLQLAARSAATSAQSERAVMASGRLIGHVLDPRTGRPVETDGSVTALAATGQDADAASTALLVMGPRAGLAWVSKHPSIEAGFLLPRPDGSLELRASPGFLLALKFRGDDVIVNHPSRR